MAPFSLTCPSCAWRTRRKGPRTAVPLPAHNVQVVVYVGTTGPRVGLDWRAGGGAGGGAGDSNYAVIQDSLTDCFVLSANFFFGTLACAPVAIPFVAGTCGLVSCMVCCENM